MTKSKMVYETLKQYSCVNSKVLSGWIKRIYNEDISPASVSGSLRKYVAQGKVGKSNCGNGSTVYWVIE